MIVLNKFDGYRVHCRIGSLENCPLGLYHMLDVHCRIGSLEILLIGACMMNMVHCRIGSLEK